MASPIPTRICRSLHGVCDAFENILIRIYPTLHNVSVRPILRFVVVPLKLGLLVTKLEEIFSISSIEAKRAFEQGIVPAWVAYYATTGEIDFSKKLNAIINREYRGDNKTNRGGAMPPKEDYS